MRAESSDPFSDLAESVLTSPIYPVGDFRRWNPILRSGRRIIDMLTFRIIFPAGQIFVPARRAILLARKLDFNLNSGFGEKVSPRPSRYRHSGGRIASKFAAVLSRIVA